MLAVSQISFSRSVAGPSEYLYAVELVSYPVSCSMTRRTATVVQLNMSWTTAQAKARPKLSLSPIWPTLTRVLVIDVPVDSGLTDK